MFVINSRFGGRGARRQTFVVNGSKEKRLFLE